MKQGEIWAVRFAACHEPEKNVQHPAVIINDDTINVLPSRVIAPISEWQDKFDDAVWLVKVNPNQVNNLSRPSAVDAFQLHSVATERFEKKIGVVSPRELRNIKKAVMAIISAE